MMAANEALERAVAIWGRDRIISVQRREDGGAWVSLVPAGIASDTRARNYSAHLLDGNGHVTCHDDCKTLEP